QATADNPFDCSHLTSIQCPGQQASLAAYFISSKARPLLARSRNEPFIQSLGSSTSAIDTRFSHHKKSRGSPAFFFMTTRTSGLADLEAALHH
ncbi:hypothetical protein ACUX4R_28985, partial [Salmonella enterica]